MRRTLPTINLSPPVLLPSGRTGQPTDRPAPPQQARPPRRDATWRPPARTGALEAEACGGVGRTRATGRAWSVRGGGRRGKVGGGGGGGRGARRARPAAMGPPSPLARHRDPRRAPPQVAGYGQARPRRGKPTRTLLLRTPELSVTDPSFLLLAGPARAARFSAVTPRVLLSDNLC
jgi:hypothetical protein